MEVRTSRDADDASRAAARSIGRRLRHALAVRGDASLALSGGSTAPAMIAELIKADLDWSGVGIWQVDERVAPDGHADRNANQLDNMPGEVHLMPVTAIDLYQAAQLYSEGLPDRFDVVHLGLGTDGHTASWPPDQPDVARSERSVAITAPFNGRVRMTLTPLVVNAARSRVMLTTGASKAAMVRGLLEGDPVLPAVRLRRSNTVLFVDAMAAPANV